MIETSAAYFAVNIWESNMLTSAVTFLVGLVALVVYKKQQIDRKKDAANIILLEIKNAESQIAQGKEIFIRDKVIPESIFAMKTSNWHKYNYLFVRDLTDEEWGLISTFYEKCAQYDGVVEYNNTFFKKNEEQIRVNLHQALADYTKVFLDRISALLETKNGEEKNKAYKDSYSDYQGLLTEFYNTFIGEVTSSNSNYFYRPQKTANDFEVVINTIRLDLSTSTIGVKLEKIIDQNLRSRVFGWLSGESKK